MTINKEIKDAMKNKKLVIGTAKVIKMAKLGTLACVIYASNLPATTKKDLNYYTKLSNIKLKGYKESSAKLGALCGKPFNILLLGIKK